MNAAPLSSSHSFLGFVPSMVIMHLLNKSRLAEKQHQEMRLPEKQSLKSVVMFADISGFTNLTETLSKRGPEGAEIIAFAINRYMELMVKEIGRSGGDIFKFAGDAMIVVWPPPKEEGQLQQTCRQAVQAALSIQSKLDNMNITDGIQLSVKIGFGVGDFSIIYVGGIFGRAEYLPAGDPLIQAFAAEHSADKGGVVNCSQQIYDLIRDHFDVIVKDASHHIYQVMRVQKKVMVKADAMMIKDNLQSQDIEKIKLPVLQYVPRSLQSYIQYEQEQWSSELRLVTILFMNIGIDLSDCADQEGLNKIQKVIQNIQKCVYMYEGSLNKFLMDDKGSTLIVVFGLPPITHQDDALRGVLCSFAIKKQLKKDNCKCSIGIGTGLVFAGVVGTSGNRREYSVIGDSVNLSARIMQKACYEKDDNFKILCSEATMRHAQHKISFKFVENCQFKGKSTLLPVFRPLDLDDKELNKLDQQNRFPSLRTHMFSFPMDEEGKAEKMSFFNFTKGASKYAKDSEDFMRKFVEGIHKKGCLIISGEMGIGKSLLLRNLIYSTQQRIDRNNQMFKYGYRTQILVSNLDPSNKFKKMNILRNILKNVIELIEARTDPSGNKLNNILKFLDDAKFQNEKLKENKKKKEYVETFKEICGLVQKNYVEIFPPPFDKRKENEVKQQLEEETKVLSQLTLEIFSIYLEQPLHGKRKSSAHSLDSSMNSSTAMDSSIPIIRLDRFKDPRDLVAPLVLCFDDIQYADAFSYKSLADILKKFNRVFIVAALRDSQLEKPVFPHPFLPTQERIFHDGIDNLRYQLQKQEHANQPDSQNKESEMFMRIAMKGLKIEKMTEVLKRVFSLDKLEYIEKKGQKERMEAAIAAAAAVGGGRGNMSAGSSRLNVSNMHYMEVQNSFKRPEDEEDDEGNNNTRPKGPMVPIDELIKLKIAKYEKEGFSYLFFNKIKQDLVRYPEHFFYNFLYFKAQGNPLLSINFIENLIAQRLLLIKNVNFFPQKFEQLPDGTKKLIGEEDLLHKIYNIDSMLPSVGYITNHLKKAILLEDLITVDVPLCKYNINTPIIDKLGCLDQLILKIASVIGDIFDVQTLQKVHPFGNVLKPDKLVETLQSLEQQNFLEIVDQNDNNVFYRFVNSFVRDTLYQRLIYTQRRQTHLIVAEALQNSVSLPHNQEDDIERLKYQWLLGENTKDISAMELPHKAKRSIIVKRIQSQLTENQNSANTIIKQDYLEKKSDYSKYSWAKRYVVMNTKDLRYYYTFEDSKEKPEDYLGAIPLRFIYEVNLLDQKEYRRKDYPFRIQASTWYKKTKQQPKRDFFFTASTKEEYEEWYIYLNIAKTKALQDEFHREYGGKVNILRGNQEIDIQLKTLLEQKRAQASQKGIEVNKRRKTTSMSSNKSLNTKQDNRKREDEIIANDALHSTQQQNQQKIKEDVDKFLKNGMILLFSHLFHQASRRNDDNIEFGRNTDAFASFKFKEFSKKSSSNNAPSQSSQILRSEASIVNEKDMESNNSNSVQTNTRPSLDFDIPPSPQAPQIHANASPPFNHHQHAQMQQQQNNMNNINNTSTSNIDKKRVTIGQNIVSDPATNSPIKRPNLEIVPRRKSILMNTRSPQAASSPSLNAAGNGPATAMQFSAIAGAQGTVLHSQSSLGAPQKKLDAIIESMDGQKQNYSENVMLSTENGYSSQKNYRQLFEGNPTRQGQNMYREDPSNSILDQQRQDQMQFQQQQQYSKHQQQSDNPFIPSIRNFNENSHQQSQQQQFSSIEGKIGVKQPQQQQQHGGQFSINDLKRSSTQSSLPFGMNGNNNGHHYGGGYYPSSNESIQMQQQQHYQQRGSITSNNPFLSNSYHGNLNTISSNESMYKRNGNGDGLSEPQSLPRNYNKNANSSWGDDSGIMNGYNNNNHNRSLNHQNSIDEDSPYGKRSQSNNKFYNDRPLFETPPIEGQIFEVLALQRTASTNGDMIIEKNEVCQATFPLQKKDLILIHRGNIHAMFFRNHFQVLNGDLPNNFVLHSNQGSPVLAASQLQYQRQQQQQAQSYNNNEQQQMLSNYNSALVSQKLSEVFGHQSINKWKQQDTQYF